jgi:hypothetical protein
MILCAVSSCFKATVLSNTVKGASPQSTIVAHSLSYSQLNVARYCLLQLHDYLEQIPSIVYAPRKVRVYTTRSRSDAIGSESSTGPCGHTSIERSTQDGNIVLLRSGLVKTVNVGEVGECGQSCKLGSGDVSIFKTRALYHHWRLISCHRRECDVPSCSGRSK